MKILNPTCFSRTPNELKPMTLFVETNPADDSTSKFRPKRIPEEGLETLRTLDLQQQFLDQATQGDRYRRQRQSKYQNSNCFEAMPEKPLKTSPLLLEKEFVASVRIYRPLNNTQSSAIAGMRYAQEILVLGRNLLCDLRDHIRCNMDFISAGDVAQDPFKPGKRIRANDLYKSGFFYIEGCFYNDMRWPECLDYSDVIRKWAEEPRRQIGPFSTAKMEETKFQDLSIRVGYPYVYVHQGNHEHVMVFNDVRLLSSEDMQRVSDYPYERSVGLKHSRYCMVCSVAIAKWVTKDDDRVPEDPYFFCDVCFRTFHYDKHKTPIGNFRAYPYVDINAI